MASEKQIAAIQKLAKICKVEYKLEDIKDLENGQLDTLFDNLRILLKSKKKESVNMDNLKVSKMVAMDNSEENRAYELGKTHKSVNMARLGLCCKLVIQEQGCRYSTKEVVGTTEEVTALYNLIAMIEESIQKGGD